MAKKILLLIHCFIPYGFPESYLAAKTMGNIPNYEVDVLTTHPFYNGIKTDSDFFEHSKKNFNNIQYINYPEWYKKMPFSRMEALFSMPDAYVYLNNAYLKKIKKLEEYSAIVTWSMCHSIHLLGLKIKKKHPNIPWVAHFSDPWTKNPFFQQGFFIKKINEILESKVFHSANSLNFTSQETMQSSLENYPIDLLKKCVVIPHAFDESLYPDCHANSKQFITISYIGNFYGDRQPDPFLKALKILNRKQQDFLESLKVHFIGPNQTLPFLDPKEHQYVDFQPSVDYLTSLKKMKESDLLLVIDAPFKRSPFLPSKLIDYIGADRPILGVTPPGPAQALIEEMGFLVASPDNSEEIATKLERMIRNIKENKVSKIPSHIRDRYSVSTVAKQMKKVLDDVIGESKNK